MVAVRLCDQMCKTHRAALTRNCCEMMQTLWKTFSGRRRHSRVSECVINKFIRLSEQSRKKIVKLRGIGSWEKLEQNVSGRLNQAERQEEQKNRRDVPIFFLLAFIHTDAGFYLENVKKKNTYTHKHTHPSPHTHTHHIQILPIPTCH